MNKEQEAELAKLIYVQKAANVSIHDPSDYKQLKLLAHHSLWLANVFADVINGK